MTQRKPKEGKINKDELEATEAEDVEALKETLEEERGKAENYLSSWQRAQADFINYKRRSEKEKEETTKFANWVLVLGLLPILDDFERALEAIPDESAEASWADGIRLIERKLRSTLEAQGLAEIKALGEPFDPTIHEAVMQESGQEGTVTREFEKGYTFSGRVIRPSKVAVGNGEKEATKEE